MAQRVAMLADNPCGLDAFADKAARATAHGRVARVLGQRAAELAMADIVSITKAGHTGAAAAEQIVRRAEFEGPSSPAAPT